MLVRDKNRIYEIGSVEIRQYWVKEKKMFKPEHVPSDSYSLGLYDIKGAIHHIIKAGNSLEPAVLTLDKAEEAIQELFQTGRLDLTEYGLRFISGQGVDTVE